MIDYTRLNKASDTFPHIVRTKDNLYTVRINNRFVHSYYTCAREAMRLVEDILKLERDKTLVILLGAGLGYHIEILEKEGFKKLIIIEQDKEIYSIFKSIYNVGAGTYVISPDDEASRIDAVFSLLDIENLKNIKTVILRGSYDKEVYRPFEERIERILQVKLGDFSTRLKFEEIWFINIIKNIANIKKSLPVKRLFGAFKNVPVLVISAGPSLKDSITAIREFEGRCIIIAVDTALSVLYEAGITPDFIYSLDSQVYNLSDFSMIPDDYLKNTRLVYDIVVNPLLPGRFNSLYENADNYTIAANTAHLDFDYNGNSYLIKNDLVNWIETAGGFRIGDIETGGSVSTSAFYLAYQMGGNPIILAGQDLAYTGLCSHSVSTSHFYKFIRNSSRLKTLQSIFMNILFSRKFSETSPLYKYGENDGVLYTDFVLNNFRGWFEESAASIIKFNSDIDLINASGQGTIIKGFKPQKLGEYLNENNFPKIDKVKLSGSFLIDSKKIDKIITMLKPLGNYINELEADPAVFESIENSEWKFIRRYFMREKIIYERYGNCDKINIERKLHRLIKAIEEINHEK